jgi:transcriptional regulator with XRE-family HTH domain
MEHRDYVVEQMAKDPEFRDDYERLKQRQQFRRSLIRARIASGMTQQELAERIGTRQSAISRLENGSASPSFDMLGRLAEALNVSFEIFPDSHVMVHSQKAAPSP